MRRNSTAVLVLVAGGALCGAMVVGCGGGRPGEESSGSAPVAGTEGNSLTSAEVAEGWRLLFDGTLDGWRGYQIDHAPGGWSGDGETLAFSPGNEGGDLITVDQFQDFELALEWKVSPGGNSGVFFRVTEEGKYAYWTGPEMQVLDNAGHADGRSALTSAGANYGLHAASKDVTRPVGEWNDARIVVDGTHVEHWLNGVQVVSYELKTDGWRALVAGAKFSEWPRYGMAERGHIGLQDHGDPVWFRNIKIREL